MPPFRPARPLATIASSSSRPRLVAVVAVTRQPVVNLPVALSTRRLSHAVSQTVDFNQQELPFPPPLQRNDPPEVTPRTRYNELVSQGILRDDPHQWSIINKLQTLHNQLKSYNPPPIVPPKPAKQSLLDRLFSRDVTPDTPFSNEVPQGLYLYGDVGTGKSMLMDLFYDTLPLNIRKKRRAHFHAFMIDVHKRVHVVKASAGHEGLVDPIFPVARDLANEATVLCFDEFQVTDIVDAMILRRLFECLIKFGVVTVMTSNRHPDDLYKNGIQRSSFIPCIDLLKLHFDVTDLDSGTDYRRIPRALSHVYYHPITPENTREVNKVFEAMAGDAPIEYSRKLKIWGRDLIVPESAGKVARFTFEELCGHPLSAADYIELTRAYNTIFVMDVPRMNLNQKDRARRFITFIDACYESKIKLFTTSEVPIHQVFSDDQVASQTLTDHQRSVMDDLGLEHDIGTSSLFSGEEEVFAFARACSRLVQMGTLEWAETAGSS